MGQYLWNHTILDGECSHPFTYQLNFDVNKKGVLLVLTHCHGNHPDMEVSWVMGYPQINHPFYGMYFPWTKTIQLLGYVQFRKPRAGHGFGFGEVHEVPGATGGAPSRPDEFLILVLFSYWLKGGSRFLLQMLISFRGYPGLPLKNSWTEAFYSGCTECPLILTAGLGFF